MGIENQLAQFGINSGAGIASGVNRGLERSERNRLLELQRQDETAERNRMAAQQAEQAERDYFSKGVQAIISAPEERWPQMYSGLMEGAQRQGYDVSAAPTEYSPDTIWRLAAATGASIPGGSQNKIGTYNPRDYTTESWSKFRQTGNDAVLERYAPSRTVESGGVTYAFDPVSQSFQPLRSTQDVAKDKRVIAREERRGKGEGASDVAGIEAEAAAQISQAREQAKLKAQKIISEQGQLGKLQDAETAYQQLKNADLDVIYGRGEKWVPEYLRSQKGIDLIARRDQLVGMLKLGARGELKGQGPITEGEQAILGQAITVLENPNISPDLARNALDEGMAVLRRNAGQTGTDGSRIGNVRGADGDIIRDPEEQRADQESGDYPPQNRQGWQLMIDAAGNRAYVGPNGQIEEI